MPDIERRKGQHLTWEDRHEIQRGLREHRSFKEIADVIGCSPDTVSKEIRNHRYHKERLNRSGAYVKSNRCKHRDTCRRRDICKKKKGNKCRISCRECLKCNELCPDFVDFPCQIEKKAPYVCNNCPKSQRCLIIKYTESCSNGIGNSGKISPVKAYPLKVSSKSVHLSESRSRE